MRYCSWLLTKRVKEIRNKCLHGRFATLRGTHHLAVHRVVLWLRPLRLTSLRDVSLRRNTVLVFSVLAFHAPLAYE